MKTLSGLTPAWLISLAMVLGTVIVVFIPISISGGEAIKASDWIGFSGNVLAGVMTIIAAIVAWFAVQRQIEAQARAIKQANEESKATQRKRDADAKFAASVVLMQTVFAAAAVAHHTARAIVAYDANPLVAGPIAQHGAMIGILRDLDAAVTALRTTMNHFAVAEAWKDLAREDKAHYLMVMSTLDTMVSIYAHPPVNNKELVVRNQNSTLTEIEKYLRAFSSEIADIYVRDSK